MSESRPHERIDVEMPDSERFRLKPLRQHVLRALAEIGEQWQRDQRTREWLAAQK